MNDINKFIEATQSSVFAHEVLLRAVFEVLDEDQLNAIAKHASENFSAFAEAVDKETTQEKLKKAQEKAERLLGKSL